MRVDFTIFCHSCKIVVNNDNFYAIATKYANRTNLLGLTFFIKTQSGGFWKGIFFLIGTLSIKSVIIHVIYIGYGTDDRDKYHFEYCIDQIIRN